MAYINVDHYPASSWWLEPDFYAAAKRELPRMRLSRYGLTEQPIYGVDVIPERPRKTAKAKEDDIEGV